MPSISTLQQHATHTQTQEAAEPTQLKQQVSRSSSKFTTELVVYNTPVPYDTVKARLEVKVNKRETSDIMGYLANVTRQDQFVALINEEAKNGFLYFVDYPHHRTLSFVDEKPKPRNELYVIGNPLIAQSIITMNPAASQSVPLRLLILEKPEGGSEAHFHLPSSFLDFPIGLPRNAELTALLARLDGLFDQMVRDIIAPGGPDDDNSSKPPASVTS